MRQTKIRRFWEGTSGHASLSILLFLTLSSPAIGTDSDTRHINQVSSASNSSTIGDTASVGFTLLNDTFRYRTGEIKSKIAVWYPTEATPSEFAYKLGPSMVTTECAYDGAVKNGSFPIIFYSHGATGAGTSSFFVCERLARAGYIVAAPDFPDEVVAARIQEPIDFDAQMSLKTYRYIYWLRHYALNKAATEGRNLYESRPAQLRQTIEVLLKTNKDSNSIFNGHIDETKIGLFGHSFGAWTSTLVAGADGKNAVAHLKAIVALSGPVNAKVYRVASSNDLKKARVPILFEYTVRRSSMTVEATTKRGFTTKPTDLRFFSV